MYHPSWPLGAQLFLIVGLRWTITFVPGGAKGVALKSNKPWSCACADREGFILDGRSRFSVTMAWSNRRHHKWRGNICVLTPFRQWNGSWRSVLISLRCSVGAGVVVPAEMFHSPPPCIISAPWSTSCLKHASLVSVTCCIAISSSSDKRPLCVSLFLILLALQGCCLSHNHTLSWFTCSRDWRW